MQNICVLIPVAYLATLYGRQDTIGILADRGGRATVGKIQRRAASCCAPRKFYSEYSSQTFVLFCCYIVKMNGVYCAHGLLLFTREPTGIEPATHKSVFLLPRMSQLTGEQIQNRSCPDVQIPAVLGVVPAAARVTSPARLFTAASPASTAKRPLFQRAGTTPATPSTPKKRGTVDE